MPCRILWELNKMKHVKHCARRIIKVQLKLDKMITQRRSISVFVWACRQCPRKSYALCEPGDAGSWDKRKEENKRSFLSLDLPIQHPLDLPECAEIFHARDTTWCKYSQMNPTVLGCLCPSRFHYRLHMCSLL